jgi:hypothetical protein
MSAEVKLLMLAPVCQLVSAAGEEKLDLLASVELFEAAVATIVARPAKSRASRVLRIVIVLTIHRNGATYSVKDE